MEPTKYLAVKNTWKISRGGRVEKMSVEFHCHSLLTHMKATILSYLQIINPQSFTSYYSSCKCTTHIMLNTHGLKMLLSELFWTSLPTSFFAMVFNSTVLKGDHRNLHNSPLIKLSWCHDLHLIHVLPTCLSC